MKRAPVDLDVVLANPDERERLRLRRGTLFTLLARLGAFPPASFDPALAFGEYQHLAECGQRVRKLMVAHPSTPQHFRERLQFHMGSTNRPLWATPEQLGTFGVGVLREEPLVVDDATLDALLAKAVAAQGEPPSYGGPEGELLRRVGALRFPYEEYAGEEDWTDWDGSVVGSGPRYVTRMGPELDPTLPWASYACLLDRGTVGRRLVGAHPSTPEDVLLKLATDAEESVRSAVAGNPGATPAALLAILPFPGLARRLVDNPASDAALLHHVATTELPKVAPRDRSTVEWILVRHPNAGDDVFDLLLAAQPHENMRIEIELRRTPR